jgi:hypothetical protein
LHVQDGIGLLFAQLEMPHQALFRFLSAFASADYGDHFVQVAGDQPQAFQNVSPCFGSPQLKLRAARDNLAAVVNVVLE